MIFAAQPMNEIERLFAIEELGFASGRGLPDLQNIVSIASVSLKAPIAAITLVDKDRVLVQAKVGLEVTSGDRRTSFCSHVILHDRPFEISDTRLDPRFHDNPWVTGQTGTRFYAGIPLQMTNGIRIGALCIAGHDPRKLSADELRILQSLANLVVAFIERLTDQQRLERQQAELQKQADLATVKLAAHANELAFVTHEFRTPISGIISITDALFETGIQPNQREHLTTILQASRQLMRLTNDILDFSKIEAGKLELDQNEFDLESLIRQTLRTFHFSALNKRLALDLEFTSQTATAYFSDAQRLTQILTNLIGNAIKFTERGTVNIRVMVQERGSDFHAIQIEVRDTGIGMNETTLNSLFRAYSQGNASIQTKFGGTGLGLVISQRLAQLLNGSLKCTSELGRGSCFTLAVPLALQTATKALPKAELPYLPRDPSRDLSSDLTSEVQSPRGQVHEEKAPTEKSPARVPSAQVLKNISLSALRILVAEDNEINQRIISAMLKKSGCRFEIVANGLEAIESFRTEHFDLVLLDAHMPRMNGFEAARLIREIAGMRDMYTPILGVTASSRTAENVKFREAGMDDTLEKPFTQTDLTRKIQSWVSFALERSAA